MRKIQNEFDCTTKLRTLSECEDDEIFTVGETASFYEVSNKAIKTIIERNMQELMEDGLITLSNEEYSKITRNYSQIQNNDHDTCTIILSKRAFVRIGVLLTNSFMSAKTRDYILNIEQASTVEQRKNSLKIEVRKIDDIRMKTAIRKYINHTSDEYNKYKDMINEVCGNNTKDVDEAETIVTALVSLGFGYEQIKVSLISKFEYKYKHLFE